MLACETQICEPRKANNFFRSKAEILDAASVLHRLVAAEDFPVAVPCDIQVMAF